MLRPSHLAASFLAFGILWLTLNICTIAGRQASHKTLEILRKWRKDTEMCKELCQFSLQMLSEKREEREREREGKRESFSHYLCRIFSSVWKKSYTFNEQHFLEVSFFISKLFWNMLLNIHLHERSVPAIGKPPI